MSNMLNETINILEETSQRVLFTAADYTIFVLLIIVSISVGIYVGITGWGTTTTKDFLVGGRKMPPFPVALSLIGGVISALSVLGCSTEMYKYGTQLTLSLIGCVWGTGFVVFIILPTLYPLDLISMMQYMILRYNSPTLKKMGSTIQICASFTYLGMCLYAPALALTSVTHLSVSGSIVLLGLVCVIYITLGGVKAVIYTDVLQTTLMFVGILTVVTVACTDIGGVAKVFEIAEKGERLEFFNFDTRLTTRHTFWNVQLLGFYLIISVIGVNQAQFQRLTSVSSLKTSQGLCIIFLFGMIILWLLYYFMGLVAYATYADCDPLTSGLIEKADQIVPFMVADKLSHLPGMSGLFVSAVYGAVLSTVSTSASAVAALLWEDFLSDWKWFNNHVKLSPITITRSLSAIAGLIGILMAFVVGKLGTTLLQAAFSILGAITSPLDGLFVTAIIAPWVTEKGAICGIVTALVYNIWLVTGKFVNGAGAAVDLPASVIGCSNVSDLSIVLLDEFTTTNSDLIYNIKEIQETSERDYLAIYDISYCFYGITGILIVLIVSSVVSIVTGPTNPYDIDERLVYKYSLSFYRKLWTKLGYPAKPTTPITTIKDAKTTKNSKVVDNGANVNQSYEMD